MKNDYKIVGDTVVIYIFYKGTRMETIIDLADLEKANSFRGTWYAKLDHNNHYVYGGVSKNGKQRTILLHRLLCNDPVGMVIDHINHNTLDNRKSVNLRVVTQAQNLQNYKLRENTTSKFRGVTWNKKKGKWIATMRKDKKLIYLGSFHCELDAAKAAQKYRLEHMPYTIESEMII
ncbi:HNH endonuclease [Paenibacillus sp. ACRRX]|uniref:AP2 domain-containing protein n=1 Tax=Paenibacillus sp. ACRRX TaxID=2918206 RepID=UPI001EF743EF|nr:AP2 domain-containing protein [Paenibacillus sp. ACRRX]MCG7406762.1 HNH endonuclease [Paenibacillus sp. ACRRX]